MYDVEHREDTLVACYIEDTLPVREAVYREIEEGNNGFTKGRLYQKLAAIPPLVYQQMCDRFGGPEWITDQNLFSKWLQTEEGAPYKIAKNP